MTSQVIAVGNSDPEQVTLLVKSQSVVVVCFRVDPNNADQPIVPFEVP